MKNNDGFILGEASQMDEIISNGGSSPSNSFGPERISHQRFRVAGNGKNPYLCPEIEMLKKTN